MKNPRDKLAHLKAKWEELLTLAKKPNDQGIPQFLLDLFKKIGEQSFDLFTTQVLAWGRHNSTGNVRKEKDGKEEDSEELYSILLSSYNVKRIQKLFTDEVWRDFYTFYKPIMESEAKDPKDQKRKGLLILEEVVAFIYKQLEIAS